jgi:hypothetical protein
MGPDAPPLVSLTLNRFGVAAKVPKVKKLRFCRKYAAPEESGRARTQATESKRLLVR